MSAPRVILLLLTIMFLGLAGCTPESPSQNLLQSDKALDRACGCKQAGGSGDKSLAPLLVDRLEDPDWGVRFYAAQALRELTGQDFDYRESDPPHLRAEAVRKWRDYVNSHGGGGGGNR